VQVVAGAAPSSKLLLNRDNILNKKANLFTGASLLIFLPSSFPSYFLPVIRWLVGWRKGSLLLCGWLYKTK
jgi:hypothetical protein